MVDVPKSPIASGARRPREQQCHYLLVVKNDGVLYHQVLQAVPKNIVYYDIVPLEFDPGRLLYFL